MKDTERSINSEHAQVVELVAYLETQLPQLAELMLLERHPQDDPITLSVPVRFSFEAIDLASRHFVAQGWFVRHLDRHDDYQLEFGTTPSLLPTPTPRHDWLPRMRQPRRYRKRNLAD